jgi:hypothetical protein
VQDFGPQRPKANGVLFLLILQSKLRETTINRKMNISKRVSVSSDFVCKINTAVVYSSVRFHCDDTGIYRLCNTCAFCEVGAGCRA